MATERTCGTCGRWGHITLNVGKCGFYAGLLDETEAEDECHYYPSRWVPRQEGEDHD